MNIKHPICILLFFFSLAACHSNSAEKSMAQDAETPVSNLVLSEPSGYNESDRKDLTNIPLKKETSETPDTKKKIIKDGNITVKSEDVTVSKTNIDKIVKELNAYYETDDLTNDDQKTSYHLTIRIPSDNFEKLVNAMETGKDEITYKSIKARDVTEEYVDIQTRLTNKREYLKRYQDLLSKANKVEEILSIEESIRVLEEEIESTEGRLKYLNDQVSFSTLDIILSHEKEYQYKAPQEDKFTERVKKSFSNGWTMVVNLVLGLFTIWPILLIMTGVILWSRRYLKKRKIKS